MAKRFWCSYGMVFQMYPYRSISLKGHVEGKYFYKQSRRKYIQGTRFQENYSNYVLQTVQWKSPQITDILCANFRSIALILWKTDGNSASETAPWASETCRNAGRKSGRNRCCRQCSCLHTRFILWLRPQSELQRLSAGELHHTHHTLKTPGGLVAELEPNKIPLQLIEDTMKKERNARMWNNTPALLGLDSNKKKRTRKRRIHLQWKSMYSAKSRSRPLRMSALD